MISVAVKRVVIGNWTYRYNDVLLHARVQHFQLIPPRPEGYHLLWGQK